MNDTTLCHDTTYNVIQSLFIIYNAIPFFKKKSIDFQENFFK